MKLEFIRSGDKEMPSVADPVEVVDLTVWYCKFRTLAPIRQLKNLRRLVVAGYPDESLEHIADFCGLQELRVLHFPKVNSLAPLAMLQALESLSLESLPSWDSSGRRLVVESLAALAALPNLKHLQLLGLVPTNQSLGELVACRSLQTARLHGYPATEVARFFASTGATDAATSTTDA